MKRSIGNTSYMVAVELRLALDEAARLGTHGDPKSPITTWRGMPGSMEAVEAIASAKTVKERRATVQHLFHTLARMPKP